MKTTTFSFLAAKHNKILIVILILGLLFSGYLIYKHSKVLFSKGQFIMDNHLVPEHVPVFCGINEIKSLPEPDKFALINTYNEFAIAKLPKNGDLEIHTILNNYPNKDLEGSTLEELFTDSEGKFFWSIATRGIFGVNSETKKTFDPLFAFGGNTTLVNTIMVDNKNEIILGEVLDLQDETGSSDGNSRVYLITYDCKNGKLGKPGKSFKGYFFYLGDNTILWCESLGKNTASSEVKWHLCDLSLENLRHNKLTDELTKKQIKAWDPTTPISIKKRMMLGAIDSNHVSTYYSIRWNQEMTEVKIEPLVLQMPPNGHFKSGWSFSDDGSWLTATVATYQPKETKKIVFFSINDSFPQGISPPVFGEETYYEKTGAFVNHSELGPLYLDISPQFHNALLVYKLNDALKILKDKMGVK
jgi:hypothetical protein